MRFASISPHFLPHAFNRCYIVGREDLSDALVYLRKLTRHIPVRKSPINYSRLFRSTLQSVPDVPKQVKHPKTWSRIPRHHTHSAILISFDSGADRGSRSFLMLFGYILVLRCHDPQLYVTRQVSISEKCNFMTVSSPILLLGCSVSLIEILLQIFGKLGEFLFIIFRCRNTVAYGADPYMVLSNKFTYFYLES